MNVDQQHPSPILKNRKRNLSSQQKNNPASPSPLLFKKTDHLNKNPPVFSLHIQ